MSVRIVVFSGTTEGRELSLRLAEVGAEVTVCVATEYGREVQGEMPGIRVLTGPLSAGEKETLLKGAAICVDATHPYATHISESVAEACRRTGTRYLRLLREPGTGEGTANPAAAADPEGGVRLTVNTAREAAEYLADRPGHILLTTGAKELPAFAGLDPRRLYPRILPAAEGLAACGAAGIPRRNIIAMQGPFSQEMNEALIRQYAISWLVTKDGGAAGGYPEKAAAAASAGAGLIVIRRPEERGLSFAEVWELCRTEILR